MVGLADQNNVIVPTAARDLGNADTQLLVQQRLATMRKEMDRNFAGPIAAKPKGRFSARSRGRKQPQKQREAPALGASGLRPSPACSTSRAEQSAPLRRTGGDIISTQPRAARVFPAGYALVKPDT